MRASHASIASVHVFPNIFTELALTTRNFIKRSSDVIVGSLLSEHASHIHSF